MNEKRLHTRWAHVLATTVILAAVLACSTAAPTRTPKPRRTPTRTAIPTWTPAPTLTLTPTPSTGIISGQVIDSVTGSPVGQANIQTDPPTVSVTANGSGRYTIPGVAPGIYTITAAKPGYGSASVAIAVTAGKMTTADVHLSPASVVTSSPEIESSLSDDLVAYYPFNGNADDESGNGNHGTVYGATLVPDRFDAPNSAFTFDGEGTYVAVPSDIGGDADFTLSAWVWIDATRSASSQATVVQTGNGCIVYWPEESSFRIDMFADRNGGATTAGGTRYFYHFTVDGVQHEWRHVTFVAFSDNTARFYIDGIEIPIGEKTTDHGVNGDYDAATIGAIRDTRHRSVSHHFAGSIDDIRIYNRALSEAEVQALYGEDKDEGLVAYYPFNGNADDESGNGNHGTVHGAILTKDRFGAPNSAYAFDGVDDYIMVRDSDTADALDVPGDQMSLSAWVKFNSVSASGSNQAILGKNNNKGAGYYLTYDVVTEDCAGRGGAYQHTLGASTNVEWCESQDHLQPHRWYHIALTYDGDLVRGYIDGESIHTSHRTGDIGNNDLDFFIGRYTGGDFHNGALDNIRIYNRALSEAEVQALYEEDKHDGLVAYYPFNGNADDESGNGNHGTVHGATLAPDRFGAPNNAYAFDGVDDHITVSDSATLDLEKESTIAAWIVFHSNPDGSSRIVEKSHTRCGYPWVVYTLRMCCHADRFAFDVTTSGSNHVLDSAHGQAAGEWHHIVGTYDGTTQMIYVDAVLDGLSGHTGSIDTNDQHVTIGGSGVCIDQPFANQHFHGLIDDVRIYNRALSEDEVRALYEEER